MHTEREVAEEWYDRVAMTSMATISPLFIFATSLCGRRSVVLLTAAVGTSVFATCRRSTGLASNRSRINEFSGCRLGVLTDISRYGDRAEKHRLAGHAMEPSVDDSS